MTNLGERFSRNLSKLYVGFLHFIPTKNYKKTFRLKAPFPKRRTFGDFQRNCLGGSTNNVHEWSIILGDLTTWIMSCNWKKRDPFEKIEIKPQLFVYKRCVINKKKIHLILTKLCEIVVLRYTTISQSYVKIGWKTKTFY